MAMPPALARGLALKSLQQAGYSRTEAERILKTKRGPGRPRKAAGGGEVAPFPGGDGVRPPGRAGALYARISAAPEVAFDQRALAAIWQGLVEALRTDGMMDPASLFPDLYCKDGGGDPEMAQERAIGREMARILPQALVALQVQASEWGQWYGRVATVRVAPSRPTCFGGGYEGQESPASPPQLQSSWGSITGAPVLAPGGG